MADFALGEGAHDETRGAGWDGWAGRCVTAISSGDEAVRDA